MRGRQIGEKEPANSDKVEVEQIKIIQE